MGKRVSETLREEMELLRSEVKVIEDSDESTPEDIERAEGLLAEWDVKKTDYDKAVAREAKVDEVLRTALAADNSSGGRTESGDGAGGGKFLGDLGRGGVQVMRHTQPYDENNQRELVRSLWNHSSYDERDTISRALAAADNAPRHVTDSQKEQLHDLLHMDNRHAPLIARHMLLTGSEQYHDEFKEYVASRGTYVGETMRAAMSLTDANGGYLVKVAS